MCVDNISITPFIYTTETIGNGSCEAEVYIPGVDPALYGGDFEREAEVTVLGHLPAPYGHKPSMTKEDTEKYLRNGKRAQRMTAAKHANERLRDDISRYLAENWDEMSGDQLEALTDFRAKICTCGSTALLREHKANGAIEYIGADSCKHKACVRCNMIASKKARQRLWNFFQKNPDLIHAYDAMHLTATVPHYSEGGFYDGFYGPLLVKTFNGIRKQKWWKAQVYAGMSSVEVTKNENGLHVHIHAFLLVEKGTQNRNKLAKDFLLAWNRNTAGASNRTELDANTREAIKRGNKLITDADIDQLIPSGATFIGLESLYVTSKTKRRGYHYCERSGFFKKYVNAKDPEAYMSGVMECIKYHFEPLALKKDGGFDVALLAEILPKLKGLRLHGKFGAFHSATKNAHPDAKMLNVNSSKQEDEEDIKEMLDELGSEIKNPITGEPAQRDDYEYLLTNLANLWVLGDEDNRITIIRRDRVRYMSRFEAPNTLVAISNMMKTGSMSAWRSQRNAKILRRMGYPVWDI